MIKLGDFNNLKIVKSVDFGLYLDGGEEGEILLPQRYVPWIFQMMIQRNLWNPIRPLQSRSKD